MPGPPLQPEGSTPRGAAVSTGQLRRCAVTVDDVALRRGEAACVCLACSGRATGSARPMPRALRRDVRAALAALDLTVSRGRAGVFPEINRRYDGNQ